MLNHTDFIEQKLQKEIETEKVLNVALNLNQYISFKDADAYATQYISNTSQKNNSSRQEKSSRDAILGKCVEEIVIYLLQKYFEEQNLDYLVTNNKTENEEIKKIVSSLKIKRKLTEHQKSFDSDVIIYNKNTFESTKRIFILSIKGTTRERIGQFLSHLFLMDKDVLNAKYGKNKYEVIFDKEGFSLKYAFVTLDWASNKDFVKYTGKGIERKTVKNTEVQLILDDMKIGGGIYVLNNLENLDGIKGFGGLVGAICDYLK